MKEINANEFDTLVLKGEKVVVDFYSSECPPCDALAPKFEGLARLYGNDILFCKIFRQQNRELAEKLEVKSSPTLLFFRNGKEVAPHLSGGIKRGDIIKNLDSMLDPDRVKAIKSELKTFSSEYDVLILGGGPGGLTAGLYLCQAKVNTILVDIALPGGQISSTHEISNYPGFIQPQPGYMLSHYMSEQTKMCGTVYKVAVDISHVDLEKKEVVIDEFETIKAKKIILATGTSYNQLNVPGEKELKGKGISYCATCDAKYYENKEVIVVGGGNSAVEEADFISRFASKITVIQNLSSLTANKKAQEKLLTNPKVNVEYESTPISFTRKDEKVVVEIRKMDSNEIKKIETDGVFIFIGMKPNTTLLGNELELDQYGYIKTNEDMQTNLPDIYAVGDVTSKKYRQITTAVADGTIAAIAISKELS